MDYDKEKKLHKQLVWLLSFRLEKEIISPELSGNSPPSSMHIVGNIEDLKQYLMHIINVESSIFATERRIKVLFSKRRKVHRENAALIEKANKTAKLAPIQRQRQLKRNLTLAKKALDGFTADVTPFPEDMPRKPLAPREPLLEKPGLFNRRKIQALNDQRLACYREQVRVYEEALQRYDDSLKSYSDRRSRYLAERDKRNEKEKQLLLSKVKNAELALEKFLSQPKEAPSIQVDTIDEEIIDKEIETAEATLISLLQCRYRLYSYNVVFHKYRNFVAVSSFYEYLISGRCASLEGPHGAYNLYETEIRANQIIAQLSVVINSLEAIKANQYLAYSQLQAVSMELTSLNEKMDSVLAAVSCINSSNKTINDSLNKIMISNEANRFNTEALLNQSAIISYNSEMSAFYSRKNAVLTDALGFMVALK